MTEQLDDGLVGVASTAKVADLVLDEENPRFSHVPARTQDELARVMADSYNAIEIARKIASEGYHVAEPPAVVRTDEGLVVVEGNRRVTALKGLLDADLRSTFAAAKDWQRAADGATRSIPDEVHVVVYASRSSARALLAHRHIRGILQWDPPEQAKWVRMLVDNDGLSFQAAADLCSMKVGVVREMYRNSRLLHDDLPGLGMPTDRLESRFSVFGLLLANKTLREHAGVLPSADITPGASTLVDPAADHRNLREVVNWVAGDGSRQPVLEDSRRIVKLGQAVAVAEGLDALRSGKSLEEALQIVADLGAKPLESAERMLTAAANSVTNALAQIELLDGEDDRTLIHDYLRRIKDAVARAEHELEDSDD